MYLENIDVSDLIWATYSGFLFGMLFLLSVARVRVRVR